MNLKDLTPKEIELMDYNQLIGLVKETNRIPGGKNTIFEILNRLLITKESKILEIGTSTGFTAIEISRLVKCKIVSIDINEDSLAEARERAKKEGFVNINFLKADVQNLPFKEKKFDLVIVGNVFSLLGNKIKALKECKRVLKNSGFICAVPMYYIKPPTSDLIKKVSDAIKVSLIPMYKDDWFKFLEDSEIELYWSKDFKFDYISDETINNFVKEILSRPHLKELKDETRVKLNSKYIDFMYLFRDNLSRMGFSIIIISKKIWEDPELYTSKPV